MEEQNPPPSKWLMSFMDRPEEKKGQCIQQNVYEEVEENGG